MRRWWIFYNKVANIVISSILGFIISFCISKVSNSASILLWVATVSFVVLFLAYGIASYYAEKNAPKDNKTLSDNVLSGLSTFCVAAARGINMQIHSIVENGKFAERIFDFKQACTLLESIYIDVILPAIGKPHGENPRVTISYLEINEKDASTLEYQYINVYSVKDKDIPNRSKADYKKTVSKEGALYYYDERLIRKRVKDIQVLATKEEIQRAFGKHSDPEAEFEYSQFIAVPIVCNDSKGRDRPIGLLEITFFDGITLGTKKQVMKFADQYISPYAKMLLLMYKSVKAMKAIPKDQETFKDAEPAETNLINI